MKVVIANSNLIYKRLEESCVRQFEATIIRGKDELSVERLNAISPRYIFFPHWSHKIPKLIYGQFECIVFHMTDVPFGRGGSPLQNLITRGYKTTKISALKVTEGIDAGPVYLKRDLSLEGTAEEIFLRAEKVMSEMILDITRSNPGPVEQEGEVTVFKRRTPAESDISELSETEAIYDAIRMLDAPGYPKAFIETKHFRLEFSRASLKSDGILADVKITRK